MAGHRHQPAHALRDLVEARTVPVGAILAEARDAGQHDARIDRGQPLVVDAQAVLDVGPEVLHHHVGRLHQPAEHAQSPFALEVERQ